MVKKVPEISDIKRKQKMEVNRLKRLLKGAGTPPERIKILSETIKNVSWMYAKLEEAREALEDEPITVEYNNGGGQSGVRLNPGFKTYETLWKSYMTGMTKIIAEMPGKEPAAVDKSVKPQTVLDMVKARRGTPA
jgi:hypothetical protein